jgi:hypothetical protein
LSARRYVQLSHFLPSLFLTPSSLSSLSLLAFLLPLNPDPRLESQVPPEAKGAEAGEARTVAAFREDPYGCTGELLAKRLHRDPFAVGPIHPSRCPELRALLNHCEPYLFDGDLPWNQ